MQLDVSMQLDVIVVVVTLEGLVLFGGTRIAVQVPTVQSAGGGIVVGWHFQMSVQGWVSVTVVGGEEPM